MQVMACARFWPWPAQAEAGCENPDDGDDNQKLDQGKAPAGPQRLQVEFFVKLHNDGDAKQYNRGTSHGKQIDGQIRVFSRWRRAQIQ